MRRVLDPWLPRLSAAERQSLLGSARTRTVQAGRSVVQRGAEANEFYVVRSGKLRASVTLETGRDLTFDVFGSGEVFGEVGLFAGGTRSADVVAVQDCELFVLTRDDLLAAVSKQPSIAAHLMQAMAERIRSLSSDIEEMGSLDAGVRFARSLVKLAERFGVQPAPQNLQVQFKLSQQDLADLVGISRVFANGRLKAWQNAGILTHKGGRLTVHDLDALRSVAGLTQE